MTDSFENVSGTLLMSAECNLDCEYCYIGKNNTLGDIDQKILDEFKNKGVFNKVKEVYDKNLERLELWGSEPTLYLEHFIEDVPDILNYFTNLSTISISSNFYAELSPRKLANLAETINENIDGRQLDLRIQVSIDGPPEWTDETRPSRDGGATTENIIKNLGYLIEEVAKLDLKSNLTIDTYFKSTVQMRFFREMAEDNDKLIKYFKFFDDVWHVYGEHKEDIDSNFTFNVSSASPTLVVPGKYTVDDGKVFAKYIRDIRKLIVRDHEEGIFDHFNIKAALPYQSRLLDVLRRGGEREQNRSFACGASGRGFSLGVDKEGHVCHRVYLIGQDDYFDIVAEDVDTYKKGRLDMFRKNMIVDNVEEQPRDLLKQQYVIKGFRDFAQQRFSYNYANVKFLSKIGQANSEYREDDEKAKLAAKFLLKVPLCVIESYHQTGSFHLMPIQGMKLWINGALTELIESRKELVERGIINE